MQNWIPNFNKLDITIDMGTILGKYTFPKFQHWHQKYLRFRKASRKVIPNRDSGQIEQNGGTVPVLIPAKLLK
jgi:hypothetical protein